MLLYSFHVYSWPVSLLKSIDKWVRNFIWSGNTCTKKPVRVAWHKIRCPFKEGGLGIRSLRITNGVAMLKLCWEFKSSNDLWVCLLGARVLKHANPVSYHVRSSIWHGIKRFYHIMAANSVWLIGNGSAVNFWKDNWLSQPVVDLIAVPESIQQNLASPVSDYICDKSWNLPYDLCSKFPALVAAIRKLSFLCMMN